MISSLSLRNFKCFRSLSLEFGAINVLAGTNGAGKSTVIQSLLAIRQSWESGSLGHGRIQLKGPLTDLGTSGEVYCADPDSDSIEIAVHSAHADHPLLSSRTRPESGSGEYFLKLDEQASPDIAAACGLFAEPFNYLHAERLGARKIYEFSPNDERPFRVGKGGENAPYLIGSERRETRVQNTALILDSSDGKEYPTVNYQWVLWMARLFPGFDGESQIYMQADQIRLGLSLQRQTGQSLFFRPTNTGFGLSYVLGVVLAGLVAQPETMLIVENPEAHLHPRAQSMIGEFLGRVAAGGTQVIVETHSEHVVNGIRRMVKKGVLAADHVRLFFFGKVPYALEPVVTPITVSGSAEISAWPDGFFDQLDQDLNAILS